MPLDWFDGTVQLTLEVALSGATGAYGTWDADMWGSATWGPGAEMADLSQRLRPPIVVNRRFAREVAAWQPGRAEFVLNNDDGALTPSNLAGPYVTGGVTQVRPGRETRLRATYNGITYPVYHGYGDDWEESWEPGTDRGTMTLPCTDEMERLGAFDGLELAAQGEGETSGLRIHRILDNAGHAGARRIDAGQVTMQATTLAQNAVTELKLVTDSEGGAFYIDADGAVVFENRYALLENTRSVNVQATFGDEHADAGLDEIPCADMVKAYRRDLIRNIVAYGRAGGTVQTVADNSSRSLYGDRRASRSDLVCETDAQVLELAQWDLARWREPEDRIAQLVIKPRRDPDRMFPVVLGLKVRDLVRVKRRAPGGVLIDQYGFVSGITHRISGDNWITTLDLASATIYLAYAASRWDVGRWDSTRWSF